MNKDLENKIIKKILSGDKRAFRHLVDNYKNMVYSIAYKISYSEEDAEEIAMDTFLKAFNKLDKFRGDSSFSTWIYRIAYNTALSWKKKKSIQAISIDDNTLQIMDEHEASPLEELINSEKKTEIRKAVNSLNDENKKLAIMFYFEEKKLKEISEELNISESNIKVKLHRIRKKLYKTLNTSNLVI